MPELLWLAIALSLPAANENLACLDHEPVDRQPSKVFYAWLQEQAYATLDQRGKAVEELKTESQIQEYQERLRRVMREQLGEFPSRAPLNAQVVGRIDGDGCVIEKVLFESQPQHHVTGNLYLPKSSPPYPAVLVSSGHSRTGKSAEYNQRFGVMLARHGMAALCYDPIGQGERSQILTAEGQPQFSGTTTEHHLIGVGSILVGANTATYRVWDGMRAIDYLASRPDIDSSRIGMTGCSGGGTLTSYVMALDERVQCAAPSCYLTTFRRLLETIGPQDAEQNLFAQLARGIDQPDYVLLRAPRPTLISSTTGDFFDIRGSWENFREAKRLYGRLGFPERVDLVEFEGRHGVQPGNLLGITKWMQRWLLAKDSEVSLAAITPLPEKELLCTPRGQVMLLPGERSVFAINDEIGRRLAGEREGRAKGTAPEEIREQVRRIAGVRAPNELPEHTFEEAGRVDREEYHIDKFVLRPKTGAPLPGLTYHPKQPGRDAYLYLHEDGKTADGALGGPIEELVLRGNVVVAIDLRGTGETASGKPDSLLGDYKTFYLAYLLGQPLVGLHTEDAIVAARFVANYKTATPRKVHLIGVGRAGIAALHAAALEPDLFASTTLKRTLPSWGEIVSEPRPSGLLTTTVHGALRVYDLPDLAKLVGSDRLKVEPAPR